MLILSCRSTTNTKLEANDTAGLQTKTHAANLTQKSQVNLSIAKSGHSVNISHISSPSTKNSKLSLMEHKPFHPKAQVSPKPPLEMKSAKKNRSRHSHLQLGKMLSKEDSRKGSGSLMDFLSSV